MKARDTVRVRTLFPPYCSGDGVSLCILSLLDGSHHPRLDFDYWTPGCAPGIERPYLRRAVPSLASRLLYRANPSGVWLHRLLERTYLRALLPGDIAYLWPSTTIGLHERLSERGVPVVLERINSHRANARRLLTEAYARLGWPCKVHIPEADEEIEQRKLELADFVFSPSPFVRESLLAAGIPEQKIFDSSYGWNPREFRPKTTRSFEQRSPRFLFAAHGDVRKGLPLLLDYWARSGVHGTLVVTGYVDPDIEERCHGLLERSDVERIPHTPDLAPVFENADVFVMPSIEEGSPIVSYLAMAAGLPCLVSPAAGSGIIRHEVEGLITDPYADETWICNLRLLAEDWQLRQSMGAAAARRAEEYTWERVAERRCQQLEEAFLR